MFHPMHSGNSDSDEDSPNPDPPTYRSVWCPESKCPSLVKVDYDDLLGHLTQCHRPYQIYKDRQPFCLHVCYRRRYGQPTKTGLEGLPGFSDSESLSSWVAAILNFDDHKFLVHVTEQNNSTCLFVTVVGLGESKNDYVAYITLALPDGPLPEHSKQTQWRGEVWEYDGVREGQGYPRLSIPNDRLWLNYAYRVSKNLPNGQPEMRVDTLYWNIRVVITKDAPLREQFPMDTRSELLHGKYFRQLWGCPNRRAYRQRNMVIYSMESELQTIRYLQTMQSLNITVPKICRIPPESFPLNETESVPESTISNDFESPESTSTDSSAESTPDDIILPNRTSPDIFFHERIPIDSPSESASADVFPSGLSESSISELPSSSTQQTSVQVPIEALEEIFFAGRLDEILLLPSEFYAEVFHKMDSGILLTDLEIEAVKDCLELYRLWFKYFTLLTNDA